MYLIYSDTNIIPSGVKLPIYNVMFYFYFYDYMHIIYYLKIKKWKLQTKVKVKEIIKKLMEIPYNSI